MPRATPNPSNVSAGIPLLDAGDYRFKIGEPKAFHAKDENGGYKNFGVRIPLKVIAGPSNVDASIFFGAYYHVDTTGGMIKQFQMAALGFDAKEERQFNEQWGDDEKWAYSYDDPEVGGDIADGAGWQEMNGREVEANVTVTIQKKGDRAGQEQNNFRWRPTGV